MRSRSIELGVEPGAVWDALTAPGLQERYYRRETDRYRVVRKALA